MPDERPVGTDAPILGVCPDCAVEIPPDRLLGSYRPAGDWPVMLAECPVCTEIVAPE